MGIPWKMAWNRVHVSFFLLFMIGFQACDRWLVALFVGAPITDPFRVVVYGHWAVLLLLLLKVACPVP